ncbi:MAG: hypothetical protein ACKO24_16475 [Leptolyngbyaceae cyanobacterium]
MNIWIAAVGSGLAVSGVTSQIAPKAIVNVPDQSPQSGSGLVINTLIHLGVGVVVALLVANALSSFYLPRPK